MEIPGYGTIFNTGDKGDGTSTTWTPVAKIKDLEPATYEVDEIDTTHMASTAKYRTFQGGLINAGEVKLTAIYSATAFNTLLGKVGVQMDAQIAFNDQIATAPSKLVMQGFIKALGPKTPLDGVDTFEITYKVSGQPTFTAAT